MAGRRCQARPINHDTPARPHACPAAIAIVSLASAFPDVCDDDAQPMRQLQHDARLTRRRSPRPSTMPGKFFKTVKQYFIDAKGQPEILPVRCDAAAEAALTAHR